MRGVSLRPIAFDDWRRVHEWASTEAAAATNLGDPTTRLILGNSLSMRSRRGRTPHPRAGSGLGRSDTNRRGHRSGRTEDPQRGSPTGGDLVCGSYCSLVRGLVDPLRDPRTSQLVVAVGRYRRCDGVAVHSTDAGWRLAIKAGSPLSYLQGDPSHPMLESDDVAAGAIEQMASTGHPRGPLRSRPGRLTVTAGYPRPVAARPLPAIPP